MGDCLSGENTKELAPESADWLEFVLKSGGLSLKSTALQKHILQATSLLMIVVLHSRNHMVP